MIVDTSALVAIAYREPAYEAMREALLSETGIIPAPVIIEFHRVTKLAGNAINPAAEAIVDLALENAITIGPFDRMAADAAVAANQPYGKGNDRGGLLNMLDLMVYGMAKARDLPILCTGRDFASTDATLHPASRNW